MRTLQSQVPQAGIKSAQNGLRNQAAIAAKPAGNVNTEIFLAGQPEHDMPELRQSILDAVERVSVESIVIVITGGTVCVYPIGQFVTDDRRHGQKEAFVQALEAIFSKIEAQLIPPYIWHLETGLKRIVVGGQAVCQGNQAQQALAQESLVIDIDKYEIIPIRELLKKETLIALIKCEGSISCTSARLGRNIRPALRAYGIPTQEGTEEERMALAIGWLTSNHFEVNGQPIITLELAEKREVLKAVIKNKGDVCKAAASLGFSTRPSSAAARLAGFGIPRACSDEQRLQSATAMLVEAMNDIFKSRNGKPAWQPDLGDQKGIEEFPADAQKVLAGTKFFTERAIALSRFLGWRDEMLGVKAGLSAGLVRSWLRIKVELPAPAIVLAVSQTLHCSPYFLMTLKPKYEALRAGPIEARITLARYAKGLTQDDLSEPLSMDSSSFNDIVRRGSLASQRLLIFKIAQILGEEPVVFETGNRTYPLYDLAKDGNSACFGFQAGYRNQGEVKALHEALTNEWKRLKFPLIWAEQIAAQAHKDFPGLAARLISAKAGTLRCAVYYGLLPQAVAAKLESRQALSGQDVTQLAKYLAVAYIELEELFQDSAAPQLKPSEQYNGIRHSWDLIARLVNKQRLLALLNCAQVNLLVFKKRVISHSANPEARIFEKAAEIAALFQNEEELAIRGEISYSERAVSWYAWNYSNPAQKLEETRTLAGQMVNFCRWDWFRPAKPDGSPEEKLNFEARIPTLLSRDIKRSVAEISGRDDAIREALAHNRFVKFLELAVQIPGLDGELEPGISEGLSCARNLVNRIAAWIQFKDPDFSRNVLNFKERKITATLVERIALLIEDRIVEFPGRADELDSFCERFALGVLQTKEAWFKSSSSPTQAIAPCNQPRAIFVELIKGVLEAQFNRSKAESFRPILGRIQQHIFDAEVYGSITRYNLAANELNSAMKLFEALEPIEADKATRYVAVRLRELLYHLNKAKATVGYVESIIPGVLFRQINEIDERHDKEITELLGELQEKIKRVRAGFLQVRHTAMEEAALKELNDLEMIYSTNRQILEENRNAEKHAALEGYYGKEPVRDGTLAVPSDQTLRELMTVMKSDALVPQELSRLPPRLIKRNGEVRLANLYSSRDGSRVKELVYTASSDYKGRSAVPVIVRVASQAYDIELEVKSKLTKKPFAIARYALWRKDQWVLQRVRTMPLSDYSNVREIISGIVRADLPQELRVIKPNSDVAQGLFVEGRVTFWILERKYMQYIKIWKDMERPIIKIDPAPHISADAWVASLWEDAPFDGSRPQIPINSIVLFRNKTFLTTVVYAYPPVGFWHTKGAIARIPMGPFQNRIKAQWNIYWLANGGVMVPAADRPKWHGTLDSFIYSFNGKPLSISVKTDKLGRPFYPENTLRYCVQFKCAQYPDRRGFCYYDSTTGALKKVALYYDSRFHSPQTTTDDIDMDATPMPIDSQEQDFGKASSPSELTMPVIVMGASTHGWDALPEIIDRLPSVFGPLLVSEHLLIPETKQFKTLQGYEGFSAYVCASPRKIIFCEKFKTEQPDNYYLEDSMILIGKRVTLKIDQHGKLFAQVSAASVPGSMHSVDNLFISAAGLLGSDVIAVVISGCGNDGSQGAQIVTRKGGMVLAQAESTANDKIFEYEMPKTAARLNERCRTVPIEQMADAIMGVVREIQFAKQKGSHALAQQDSSTPASSPGSNQCIYYPNQPGLLARGVQAPSELTALAIFGQFIRDGVRTTADGGSINASLSHQVISSPIEPKSNYSFSLPIPLLAMWDSKIAIGSAVIVTGLAVGLLAYLLYRFLFSQRALAPPSKVSTKGNKPAAKTSAKEASPQATQIPPLFLKFMREFGTSKVASERITLLSKFWQEVNKIGTPLVTDNGNNVVFLYRGRAQSVSLICSLINEGEPLEFSKFLGTDLFHLYMPLPPHGRLDYKLVVDGQVICDPLQRKDAMQNKDPASSSPVVHAKAIQDISGASIIRYPQHTLFKSGDNIQNGGILGVVLTGVPGNIAAAVFDDHEIAFGWVSGNSFMPMSDDAADNIKRIHSGLEASIKMDPLVRSLFKKAKAVSSPGSVPDSRNRRKIVDFTLVKHPGKGVLVALIAKTLEVSKEQRRNYQTPQAATKLRENIGNGVVALVTLGSKFDLGKSSWKQTGPEPHGFVMREDITIIGFINELRIFDTKAGKLRKVVKNHLHIEQLERGRAMAMNNLFPPAQNPVGYASSPSRGPGDGNVETPVSAAPDIVKIIRGILSICPMPRATLLTALEERNVGSQETTLTLNRLIGEGYVSEVDQTLRVTSRHKSGKSLPLSYPTEKIEKLRAEISALEDSLAAIYKEINFPGSTTLPKYVAVSDIHGNQRRLRDIIRQADRHAAEKIILVGDIYSGKGGWEIYRTIKPLVEQGRLVPLLGNNDLFFLRGMLGDDYSLELFMAFGGRAFLDEFNAQNASGAKAPMDLAAIRACPELREMRAWIQGTHEILYLDFYGTAYLHSFPQFYSSGKPLLFYKGKAGPDALYQVAADLKEAARHDDPALRMLSQTRASPVWSNGVLRETADFDDAFRRYGICRIVHGHKHKTRPVNMRNLNRQFGIAVDFDKGRGGYLLIGPAGMKFYHYLSAENDDCQEIELMQPEAGRTTAQTFLEQSRDMLLEQLAVRETKLFEFLERLPYEMQAESDRLEKLRSSGSPWVAPIYRKLYWPLRDSPISRRMFYYAMEPLDREVLEFCLRSLKDMTQRMFEASENSQEKDFDHIRYKNERGIANGFLIQARDKLHKKREFYDAVMANGETVRHAVMSLCQRIIRHPDPAFVIHAMRNLAEINSEESIGLLCGMLSHPSKRIRDEVLRILPRRAAFVLPIMAESLKSKVLRARFLAYWMVFKIDDSGTPDIREKAKSLIVQSLAVEDDWLISMAAKEWLRKQGYAEGLSASYEIPRLTDSVLEQLQAIVDSQKDPFREKLKIYFITLQLSSVVRRQALIGMDLDDLKIYLNSEAYFPRQYLDYRLCSCDQLGNPQGWGTLWIRPEATDAQHSGPALLKWQDPAKAPVIGDKTFVLYDHRTSDGKVALPGKEQIARILGVNHKGKPKDVTREMFLRYWSGEILGNPRELAQMRGLNFDSKFEFNNDEKAVLCRLHAASVVKMIFGLDVPVYLKAGEWKCLARLSRENYPDINKKPQRFIKIEKAKEKGSFAAYLGWVNARQYPVTVYIIGRKTGDTHGLAASSAAGSTARVRLEALMDEELIDLAQENLLLSGNQLIFGEVLTELTCRGWNYCFVLLRNPQIDITALSKGNFINLSGVSIVSVKNHAQTVSDLDRFNSARRQLEEVLVVNLRIGGNLARRKDSLNCFIIHSLTNILQHVKEGAALYLLKPEKPARANGQQGIGGFRVVVVDHGGGLKDEKHSYGVAPKDLPINEVMADRRTSFGYGGHTGVGFMDSIRDSNILRVVANKESAIYKNNRPPLSFKGHQEVFHASFSHRVNGLIIDASFYEDDPQGEYWAEMVCREQTRLSRIGREANARGIASAPAAMGSIFSSFQEPPLGQPSSAAAQQRKLIITPKINPAGTGPMQPRASAPTRLKGTEEFLREEFIDYQSISQFLKDRRVMIRGRNVVVKHMLGQELRVIKVMYWEHHGDYEGLESELFKRGVEEISAAMSRVLKIYIENPDTPILPAANLITHASESDKESNSLSLGIFLTMICLALPVLACAFSRREDADPPSGTSSGSSTLPSASTSSGSSEDVEKTMAKINLGDIKPD
ncbi:MAG: chemotaxis protein CheB, partial [Candidatus Omnitrophica bacterium]|nr:chemotaxis protein CheB [Candidatus Omnitrophota bacterium]